MKKDIEVSLQSILYKQLRTQKILLWVVCIFCAFFIVNTVWLYSELAKLRSGINSAKTTIEETISTSIPSALSDIDEALNDIISPEDIDAIKELADNSDLLKDIDIEKLNENISYIKEVFDPIQKAIDGINPG